MGISEIVFVGLVAISLGGCFVYSIFENKKNNQGK